jgi:uroporphyrinogen-III synthase
MDGVMDTQPLAGRTIAVPESREIELFAALLERRGARVVRCPMVAIRDAPDPEPILDWSRKLAAGGFDDLVFLTGEGIQRILSCIDSHEPALRGAFVHGLASARKITRGPKPARALRELGLKTDIAPERPTTEGIIDSLRGLDLRGRRFGVQLYGTDPNRPLVDFLAGAGASVSTVAPYVYADAADDQAVAALLERMRSGGIDAIAFTSTPQVERVFAAAAVDDVRSALGKTLVAAVGPVVGEALHRHGVQSLVMPEASFFLKPLTTALEDALRAKR